MDIRSKKEHVFLKRKKGSKERKKATRTAFVSQFLLTLTYRDQGFYGIEFILNNILVSMPTLEI